jgi:hypothetical protein
LRVVHYETIVVAVDHRLDSAFVHQTRTQESRTGEAQRIPRKKNERARAAAERSCRKAAATAALLKVEAIMWVRAVSGSFSDPYLRYLQALRFSAAAQAAYVARANALSRQRELLRSLAESLDHSQAFRSSRDEENVNVLI